MGGVSSEAGSSGGGMALWSHFRIIVWGWDVVYGFILQAQTSFSKLPDFASF
jgi:hypothetical protein